MSAFGEINHARTNRWYFGGTASAISAAIVHPLDLLKVLLQTQQTEKQSIKAIIKTVYKNKGLTGFYVGVSASLMRQLTCNMARFGLYEVGKKYIDEASFAQKVGLSMIAGSIAGALGVPAEKVNVRMQNDTKLPPEKRLNYKHVFDGIGRVYKEEGFKQLFAGGSFFILRSVIIGISQNAVYSQTKEYLLQTPYFDDNIILHFTCSMLSAGLATVTTQPLDVMKTRSMRAKPGEFRSKLDLFYFTAKLGPLAFFKGSLPVLARLAPHYSLLFIIMEQMRLRFGHLPANSQ